MQAPTTREIVPNSANQDAIYEQLNRLLASPFFSNSKRYPALLRHVVVQTIQGQSGDLKERSLGIQVFNRDADYDTNTDPVVRITAGEIRKRLAQYYCEPAHEAELRIDIPTGTYVPSFRYPPSKSRAPRDANRSKPSPPPATGVGLKRRMIYAPAVLVLAALAFASVKLWIRQTPTQQFWGPVLESSSPILVCVGQPDKYVGSSELSTTESKLGPRTVNLDRVVMGDAIAAARVTGILGKAGTVYSLQGGDSATFADIRRGPSVLVGAADNPWTMRATSDLRFHFVGESSGVLRIEDRKNPAQREWHVDFDAPYTSLTQDYAIVGRFLDPTTGQFTVVAAGLGVNGTISASEFLADSKYLREITSRWPRSAAGKNIEAVIGTRVIDGKSGPPRLLAVQYW